MTEQEKDAWMYEHGSVSGASNRDLPPVTDALDAMADAMGMPPVAQEKDTRLPALARMTTEELHAWVDEWVRNA